MIGTNTTSPMRPTTVWTISTATAVDVTTSTRLSPTGRRSAAAGAPPRRMQGRRCWWPTRCRHDRCAPRPLQIAQPERRVGAPELRHSGDLRDGDVVEPPHVADDGRRKEQAMEVELGCEREHVDGLSCQPRGVGKRRQAGARARPSAPGRRRSPRCRSYARRSSGLLGRLWLFRTHRPPKDAPGGACSRQPRRLPRDRADMADRRQLGESAVRRAAPYRCSRPSTSGPGDERRGEPPPDRSSRPHRSPNGRG